MAAKTPDPSSAPRRRGRPRREEIAAQIGSTVSEFPEGPADADGLTPRQRKMLQVIRDTIEARGYPPSIREIADAAGLASSSSVAHQLKVLEAKGYLRRDPHRPRAMEVRLPGSLAPVRPAMEADLDETGIERLALYVDPTARANTELRGVGLPLTLLIDTEGREIGRLLGPAEWDSEDALRLIRSVLKQS